MDARADRDHRDMRARQALTYSLARLVAVAVNNPKKMPEFDQAFRDPRRKRGPPKTPAEMLQAMRAWTDAIRIAERD